MTARAARSRATATIGRDFALDLVLRRWCVHGDDLVDSPSSRRWPRRSRRSRRRSTARPTARAAATLRRYLGMAVPRRCSMTTRALTRAAPGRSARFARRPPDRVAGEHLGSLVPAGKRVRPLHAAPAGHSRPRGPHGMLLGLLDLPERDVTRLVDAGLDGQHGGKLDSVSAIRPPSSSRSTIPTRP